MALTPEQTDEWRDLERLFGESGWHRLMRKLEHRVANIKANSLYTVKDEKDLWKHRGWVDILEEILRYEATMRAQKDAMEQDAAGESELHPYENDNG